MSALWTLAYLKTEAALCDVFDASVQASRDELNDKLHVQDYDQSGGFRNVTTS